MDESNFQIPNFEFSKKVIENAVKNNQLLSIEIECSLKCNFRCPYCYVPHGDYLEDELSVQEIQNVIIQAKRIGAQKIIILGGEPTLYPYLLDIIYFVRSHHLKIELFTNGTGINDDMAHILFQQNVRVVLKMNTFNEKLQNRLAGNDEAFRIIHEAFKALKKAGYPSTKASLAVSTVICKQNLQELPEMWTWLRDQNIIPYFEIITPQENAKRNKWLDVSSMELKKLFFNISEIDRRQYNQDWDPQPPLIGNKCMRHQFSCLVNSTGDVRPCVGVDLSIGNVRYQTLQDILIESDVMKNLKDYRNQIKGTCQTCEKAEHCYGCRGAAYQLTGDYLASDPTCWENEDS